MAAIEKKINLEGNKTKHEERRFELTTASEDTKILTMRMDELDDDAAIVHAIRIKMLKRLADEMEVVKKEAAKKEPDGEEEAVVR